MFASGALPRTPPGASGAPSWQTLGLTIAEGPTELRAPGPRDPTIRHCLAPGAPPQTPLTGVLTLRHPAGTITVYDSSFVLVAVACFWGMYVVADICYCGSKSFYNLPLGQKLDPRLSMLAVVLVPNYQRQNWKN